MQVKCSASTWAQQSSLSSASHLWLGCSQQEFIYQSLSKVEDQQAQTGLSSTTNWAFVYTCLRKSQGRLIFLSSSVTVKSLAKGMKHLAALILSDSNHSALEQLEYGFRQNTQISPLWERIWGSLGRRQYAAKVAWRRQHYILFSASSTPLCIYMLHCIEKQETRLELASPTSQVNLSLLVAGFELTWADKAKYFAIRCWWKKTEKFCLPVKCHNAAVLLWN